MIAGGEVSSRRYHRIPVGAAGVNPAPFSEFAWATHLRRHIPLSLVEHDFDAALWEALSLSSDHSAAAPRPLQAASRIVPAMSPEMEILLL